MAATLPLKPDATTPPAPVNLAQCQAGDLIFVSRPTDTAQISNCSPFNRVILCLEDKKDKECIESIPKVGVIKPRPLREALELATYARLYRHKGIDDNSAAWLCQFARGKVGVDYDPPGEARADVQSGCAEMLPGSVSLSGVSNHKLNPQKAMVIWFDDLGQGDTRDSQEAHHDKSFFCSEFIARCFEWAWVPLVDYLPPHGTSMRALINSNKLQLIDTLIAQETT